MNTCTWWAEGPDRPHVQQSLHLRERSPTATGPGPSPGSWNPRVKENLPAARSSAAPTIHTSQNPGGLEGQAADLRRPPLPPEAFSIPGAGFWRTACARRISPKSPSHPAREASRRRWSWRCYPGSMTSAPIREGTLDILGNKIDLTQIRVLAHSPWYPGWVYAVPAGAGPGYRGQRSNRPSWP